MTHYLKQYTKFSTIEEMDRAAELHLKRHYGSLTKSDRHVLDIIRRYSVKYGAAHLKHITIEEITGRSNVTVRRAVRKLVTLGIIEKIHFIRPVMSGLGANIYIVLPFDDQSKMTGRSEAAKPQHDAVYSDLSETEALPSKSIKDKDLTSTSPAEMKKESTSLFSRMKELLVNTIGNAKSAREFYGIHRAVSSSMLKYEIYKEDKPVFEELAIRALTITLMTTKKKAVRNLPGYFKGVLNKLIDEMYFSDVFTLFDKPVEFVCPAN